MEINDAQESSSSASVLVCFLYVDNGKLVTRLYDKRNDFNFSIVCSPILTSNIRSAPVCGVYVSQLVCYARTGSKYQDFVDRREKLVLTDKISMGDTMNLLIHPMWPFLNILTI